jgi:hypothetical protein
MVEHSINLEHCIELQSTNILSAKHRHSNILYSVLLTSLGSLTTMALILPLLISTLSSILFYTEHGDGRFL